MANRKPKLMPIPEAVEEAQRWLAYLDAQETKARQLGEIASARRAGTMDENDARRAVDAIQRRMGLVVYDGARLAEAVKAFVALSETADKMRAGLVLEQANLSTAARKAYVNLDAALFDRRRK